MQDLPNRARFSSSRCNEQVEGESSKNQVENLAYAQKLGGFLFT